MSVVKPAALRTPDELADAIQGLSDAEWNRLRKVAVAYARGRTMEPQDLLQESFRRALDGRRNCPTGVDAVKFLAEAMRSIADSEHKKGKDQPPLVPIANHGAAESVADPPDPGPDPEQNAGSAEEAAAMKASLLTLFEDDETAQIILEGMMEGMQGEELRDLTELDKTAYESKRRLIRRRIDMKFPQGLTS